MSMTMTSAARTPRQITGKKVLLGFIAFFGVIISVNMVFVYFALNTWPGLTTDDAYMRGLNYNQTLADGERQTALGWRTDVTLGQKGILVRIQDRAGAPVTGYSARVSIARPLGDLAVVTADLSETAPGLYTALFEGDAQGRFLITVLVDDADGSDTFKMQHKLNLR